MMDGAAPEGQPLRMGAIDVGGRIKPRLGAEASERRPNISVQSCTGLRRSTMKMEMRY